MKRIHYLHLTLDDQLTAHELSGLRGALATKVGWQHDLFHNHRPGDQQYHYRYSLIQYKSLHRRPTLLCLGDGVAQVQHLFLHPERNVQVNGRTLSLKINRMQTRQHNLQVWNTYFFFRIKNWLALNQKNYERYHQSESELERKQLLEELLEQHIETFCLGVGYQPQQAIEVKILDLPRVTTTTVKSARVLSFTADFCCNVSLPYFIGLGKRVSLGYGTIFPLRKSTTQPKNTTSHESSPA